MSKAMEKKLPIGIENFEEIRTEGFYYIDKTGLIKDLLCNWGKVNLFTRPRRFGKSLNMSMLKSFFEVDCNGKIFDGLSISKETELCERYMGQFPVISISLKSVNGSSFDVAASLMRSVIGNEALRFYFLLESERLNDREKKQYEQLINVDTNGRESFTIPEDVLMGSIKLLSFLLYKHYGKKVILLIDEYDVPLAKAFDNGYYEQMVLLIRNIFEQALKTNDSLHFAVLTGCLRIAKESIFTGFNNLQVFSITDTAFGEYFGFTDREVKDLLGYYGLSEFYDTVKEWYDGYRFGTVAVYCPWDVICYCGRLRTDREAEPENYWSNTSSNDIVRHFVRQAENGATKREIERLVEGEAIEKEIYQELTYKELYDSIDNIWSVLFTTGYLTQRGKARDNRFQLVIPNLEIRRIFTRQIMELFKDNVKKDGEALERFCKALEAGDGEGVEQQFNGYLKKTISIRDTFVRQSIRENFYHGILLGLLSFKDSWYVASNRESGEGYSDILVEVDDGEVGIIVEVKYSDNADLDGACKKAMEQIEKKEYEAKLREDGMQTILKYGIACYKKSCRVLVKRSDQLCGETACPE